jgi:hypothetical protein
MTEKDEMTEMKGQANLSLHCPLFTWRHPRRLFNVEPNPVLSML